MKKIRWGILSSAKIGMEKVTPAMQRGDHCEVVAIASRSVESARQAADRLSIPAAYGSYEELLAAGDVDAVYIPLPNHMHVEWSKKTMLAGKHLLCEKPLALTAGEIEELIEVRDRCGVKAGEAFMVKANPQWISARQKVRDGELGALRMIQGQFSYYNVDPQNIRNIPEVGGGAIWDIGCYPVTTSRYLFGEEPERVVALLEFDPVMKTDRLGSVIMDFPSGQAVFGVSTQLAPYQRVHLFGTEAHLEVVIPFNAPIDRPNTLLQDTGDILLENVVSHSFPVADQYTLQGDLFSRAILEDGEVPSTFEDALLNTRVLQAIFESARSGGWVKVG